MKNGEPKRFLVNSNSFADNRLLHFSLCRKRKEFPTVVPKKNCNRDRRTETHDLREEKSFIV